MKRWGWVILGLAAAGCGHEQTTGNAVNSWSTPVGYGSIPTEAVRRLDPTSPPTLPKKGAARQVYLEEQAPIQALEAEAGVAPPVERGSALPPETVAPPETLPPPADVTPPPAPSDLPP
ncbi:MAG: hypothetical protein JWN44_2890 [Myxococcales bacterium]|nr:hypothetical protein [Myxococcales bacterium]